VSCLLGPGGVNKVINHLTAVQVILWGHMSISGCYRDNANSNRNLAYFSTNPTITIS